MVEVSKYEDAIDSRDVEDRITELTDLTGLDEDEAVELAALEALASQGRDGVTDWKYGETLLRDSYFEDYARELAEDIGAISGEEQWPLSCIDWERAADQLKMDYTAVDFDGVTYWARS